MLLMLQKDNGEIGTYPSYLGDLLLLQRLAKLDAQPPSPLHTH